MEILKVSVYNAVFRESNKNSTRDSNDMIVVGEQNLQVS